MLNHKNKKAKLGIPNFKSHFTKFHASVPRISKTFLNLLRLYKNQQQTDQFPRQNLKHTEREDKVINKRTFFAGVSTTLCKNQQFSLLRVQDFNPSRRPPVHDERCTVCGGAFRRCQQTWAETPETSILVKALRDCRLRGRAGSNYGNKHEQEHQRDLWTDLSPLKLHQEDLLPLDLSCSVWGGSWGAWRMRRGGWWKSWSDFGFRSSFQVQWITTAFFSCDGFWKIGARVQRKDKQNKERSS